MKNELFDSDNNYSRLGKYFFKKYLYLYNRKDYISNLKKILAAKQERDYTEDLTFNNDIFSQNSKYDKNIFDINYENQHDKIIEKQMKKYLSHKDNYKFHTIHVNSNTQRKKGTQEESHKLTLFSSINTENQNSLLIRNEHFYSFDNNHERNSTKEIKKINKNNNLTKIAKAKKNEILKLKRDKINNNNFAKVKNGKKDYKTINKKELSQKKLFKSFSEKINFPSIQNNNNLTTLDNTKTISPKSINNAKISIKKIHLNDKLKKKMISIQNEKNYFSSDNSRHIRSVNFSKMISRKTNKSKKSDKISSIFMSISPKYDSIYPKTIINFLYKDKIPRKDFSPKYRKYNNEFILDLDKVYNKYNNHRETLSFSIDKTIGRKDLFNKEAKELSKLYNGQFSERKINDIKINKNIIDIMKLYKSNNLTSKAINQYGYKANDDFLENIYKKIIKNILNKEKKTIKEARLKKIINGNKINSNYKKLFNIFVEHRFLNDLTHDNHHIMN